MKLLWNSWLITLSLVLPIATPALAELPLPSRLAQANSETRPTLPASEPTPETSEEAEDLPREEEDPEPANAETSEEAEDLPREEEGPDPANAETSEEAEESSEEGYTLDPEEAAKQAERRRLLERLAEADRLYVAGDIAAAEAIYQEVKPPFSDNGKQAAISTLPEPLTDPEQLSPASRVYWREAQAGWESKLESRIFVPLEFLVEASPEFLPGHLLLAEAYTSYKHPEKAVEVLERATTFYPNSPELLRVKIAALAATEQWLEASIAARQFALLNPDHPDAEEFATLAEDNFGKFRGYIRKVIAGNAIGNVVTGAIGVALTGNPLGALSAVETLVMLARGESAIGRSIANQAIEELEMVEDEKIVTYVQQLGEKLSKLSGRDDFEYEFYVIKDKNLNAFALPGGKIFVNAGALLHSDTEAELAGLITHELAHTVLSHGFQMVTHGNLIGNMARYVPFGGTLANLLVLDYSRDMEQQADVLGTRLLTSAGYSADGLRNLMVKLKEQYGEGSSFWKFMSSHPPTKERIADLETLIERGGYNRFAYEGVEQHQEMRQRVAELLREELSEEDLVKLDIELEEVEIEETEEGESTEEEELDSDEDKANPEGEEEELDSNENEANPEGEALDSDEDKANPEGEEEELDSNNQE
ncbi:M48 family metalloprotease [Laspinema olomoucense]|uniref:M48 family metalloprotease n=1 Tax=Laspinema olomoucense TaxID=3231600 RepID=UPI0021BA6775|nr:M48 family metalloprotease [Laspinema sp. D3d]MCT7975910.1 M48 family metalloprotease [Laspinema sp. D3d]